MLKRKYIVALGVGLLLVLGIEWLVLHRNPKPPRAAAQVKQPQTTDGGGSQN